MHLPGAVRVFADEVLIGQIGRDRSVAQLVNVTSLPGIYGAAMGMPDMHEGYGFPVGGVAATLLPDGVISPGGIGFVINCGVRLLAAPQKRSDLADRIESIVHDLSRAVPAGMGRGQGGAGALDTGDLDRVLTEGVPYLVKDKGLGEQEDLEFIESGGALPGADAAAVSDRAKLRGGDQLGTLGSGNHFLEVQVVDEIFDARTASAFGLEAEQIVILIHSGSRGLGHQVCTDYVQRMDRAAERYGYTLPDRQLACAPLSSAEGKGYFAAMAAAANFGFGNRQVITQRIRGVWRRAFGASGQLRLLYDVAHNTAKIERHGNRNLCVHRKGATRAFGPSASELPPPYRGVGQPVLIPGSMGTSSFVLVGTDQAAELTWSSSCHGAGRAMSRGAAKRAITGQELRRQLAAQGIVVRCPSNAELAEEAPLAYKDVDRVVDVVHRAGVARKVVRLKPLGVVKG
jgi:tRNA-splicing ligase RtcB